MDQLDTCNNCGIIRANHAEQGCRQAVFGSVTVTQHPPIRTSTAYSQEEACVTNLRAVLEDLGMDVKDPELQKTPQRWYEALKEFFNHAPNDSLETTFEYADDSTMVVQTDIPFRMLCAHHLFPATGTAAVAYIPKGKILGLSKLSRIVDGVATTKPWTQEHICQVIAHHLDKILQPVGVGVLIEAEHTCMTVRGAQKPGVKTKTTCVLGAFLHVPAARQEFFSLVTK